MSEAADGRVPRADEEETDNDTGPEILAGPLNEGPVQFFQRHLATATSGGDFAYDQANSDTEADDDNGVDATRTLDMPAPLMSAVDTVVARERVLAERATAAATNLRDAEPMGGWVSKVAAKAARKAAGLLTREADTMDAKRLKKKQEKAAAAATLASMPPLIPLAGRTTSEPTPLRSALPPLVPLASRTLSKTTPARPALAESAAPQLFAAAPRREIGGGSGSRLLDANQRALLDTIVTLTERGPFHVARDIEQRFAEVAPPTGQPAYDGNLVLASALGHVRHAAEMQYKVPFQPLVALHRRVGDAAAYGQHAPLDAKLAQRTADSLGAFMRTETAHIQSAAPRDNDAQAALAMKRGAALGAALVEALGPEPLMRTLGVAASTLTELVSLTQDRATHSAHQADTQKRLNAFWAAPLGASGAALGREHFE